MRQVLAPFAIGMVVFLCHLVAIPLDGCRSEDFLTFRGNTPLPYNATASSHDHFVRSPLAEAAIFVTGMRTDHSHQLQAPCTCDPDANSFFKERGLRWPLSPQLECTSSIVQHILKHCAGASAASIRRVPLERLLLLASGMTSGSSGWGPSLELLLRLPPTSSTSAPNPIR